MPRVFPKASNTIARASFLAALLAMASAMAACLVYTRTSYGTGAGIVRVQPVPFSHEHHVSVLGLDCRYCHTSVEHSARAGMPPTKTCMNCHSQIWVGSDMLRPVRESYRTDESIPWQRVHNLPGFVYFNHSIHVQKGVGCSSCHGRIDQMPLTHQVQSLLMEWCLDCHRRPEPHLRPRGEVFNMRWQPPLDQARRGAELAEEYQLRDTHYLTSCSVCHR